MWTPSPPRWSTFAAATLWVGALMRWDRVVPWAADAGLSFENLRHAHSHVGFYGALTLAWWLTSRVAPGPRTRALYAGLCGLATVLFAALGYHVSTIVLSTVIAGFWLRAGWQQWRAGERGWLGAVPLGLLAGTALVPLVAVTARRDFMFSRDLAHAMVAILLFGVFVPSAWQAARVPPAGPAWLLSAVAAPASVALIFPREAGAGGAAAMAFLSVHAGLVLARWKGPLALRAAWLAVPLGMLGALFIPALREHAWRMTGLHAVLLGAVLPTFRVFQGAAGAPVTWTGAAAWYAPLGIMLLGMVSPWSGAPAVVAAAGTVLALAGSVEAWRLARAPA